MGKTRLLCFYVAARSLSTFQSHQMIEIIPLEQNGVRIRDLDLDSFRILNEVSTDTTLLIHYW